MPSKAWRIHKPRRRVGRPWQDCSLENITVLVRMRDDHPSNHEVKEQHGVNGQGFPLRGLTIAQKLHRSKSGPTKTY